MICDTVATAMKKLTEVGVISPCAKFLAMAWRTGESAH